MQAASDDIPIDYPAQVRDLRERLELTQVQMAERIGVSFATVNRWENGKSTPTSLAWRRMVELDASFQESILHTESSPAPAAPVLDFTAKPEVVAAVAEATRLAHGHLFNPAFATEISSIDPLPHQRIAVYEHMLKQSPLRFLLADDAGAGKTIMTGLYLRETMARQLLKRILVVPPAGLVGNWEREMRTLFRLPFRIVRGTDARVGNPFTEPGSDRVIVSIDTLVGERMFGRLREAVTSGAAPPYDLVVFDEAHKLAADRGQDFRVRKTGRYRLAEALAGLPVRDERWKLGWSAPNILLLTATPHMGKDFPYYCLWRLLAPDALPTLDAFEAFPQAQRSRHFIRRTKEEMVRFDGRPLYPQRNCDTLSYALSRDEQALYDATTSYIAATYNRARVLNRSAARLAMSVFQRRLASSSYALMRSFERRLIRIDEAIALVQEGRSDELEQRQTRIGRTADVFETRLIGLRQESDGTVSACPLEHLLLLRGAEGIAPGSVPLALLAQGFAEDAAAGLREAALGMAAEHRTRIGESLSGRRRWITAGYAHRTAELMQRRRRMSAQARQGDAHLQAELDLVKQEQSRLAAEQQRTLTLLDDEPSSIEPGETKMIAHALVVPTEDPEERQRHDANVETIAMDFARAHEEAADAQVQDVSRPALARRAGLGDWPGFDLRSLRPAGAQGPAQERAIEVKGRAGTGSVEVSENEWAAACNLRDRYWLYAVFDCATPRPRLVKVRDPFGRLLAKARGSVIISATDIQSASMAESN